MPHWNTKSHTLKTITKPIITYTYYAVSFSEPNIKILDQKFSKLTREICNLPNSTSNILTHLSNEDFGINTTALILDYIHCIGKQLLNDQDQLGQIYQGLIKSTQQNTKGPTTSHALNMYRVQDHFILHAIPIWKGI